MAARGIKKSRVGNKYMCAQSLPTLCNPMDTGAYREENWRGLPFPPPGNLPNPGTEPASPKSPTLAGRFFITEPPGKPVGNQKKKQLYQLMNNSFSSFKGGADSPSLCSLPCIYYTTM